MSGNTFLRETTKINAAMTSGDVTAWLTDRLCSRLFPISRHATSERRAGVGVNDRVRSGTGRDSDKGAPRLMRDLRFQWGCLAPAGHYFDVPVYPPHPHPPMSTEISASKTSFEVCLHIAHMHTVVWSSCSEACILRILRVFQVANVENNTSAWCNVWMLISCEQKLNGLKHAFYCCWLNVSLLVYKA